MRNSENTRFKLKSLYVDWRIFNTSICNFKTLLCWTKYTSNMTAFTTE